jgi:cellulose biosynthesis protein BcsQ
VRPILDIFHNLSLKTGSRIEPQFILTKFDHNVSLHTDLRKWLSDELKSLLLPIVIRRSDEVSEALAEGETIVDYAPNSGVSEDFHRLAEWVQTRSQSTESATYPRSAATGD